MDTITQEPISELPATQLSEYPYTLDEVIKQVELSGVNLGESPRTKINSFINAGLMPLPDNSRYPAWTVQRIIAIENKLMEGKSLAEIRRQVRDERKRFLSQVTDLDSMARLYRKFSNNALFTVISYALAIMVAFGFLAVTIAPTNPAVVAGKNIIKAAVDSTKKVAKSAVSPVGRTLVTIIKTSKPEGSPSADPLGLTNLEVATPVVPENLVQLDSLGNLIIKGEVAAISFSGSGENLTNLLWSSLIDRPKVLSAIDGVSNDEGGIDMVAGAGITISPDDELNTITLSAADIGSAQFIFKNIAVSGQTTIASDINADTLTLTAGSNVVITQNAETDTITIGVTGTVSNADTLDLLDSSQFLRSDAADSFTSGTLTISGGTTLSILGSFSCIDCVGDAAIPNTITASNYLPLGGGTMAGNINLGGNSLTNIGASATNFSAVGALNMNGMINFFGDTTLYRASANFLATSGDLRINGDQIQGFAAVTVIDLSARSLQGGTWNMFSNFDFNTNLALNIGAAGTDFTAGGGLTLAGNLTANAGITVSGNLSPAASPSRAAITQTITTVHDPANDVAQGTSIAIGTDGFPVIAYHDETAQDLLVAKCNDVACTGGDETITTVDSAPTSMSLTLSIAIGADGLPVISYQDATAGDLKVAKCGNASCSSGNTVSVVDPANVGGSNDIAIGTDGMPVISYYELTNGSLRMAYCNDAACSGGDETLSTVEDPANGVGMYNSIAIGGDGLPVISYHDSTADDVKVAKCGNLNCSSGNVITIVDSGGDVGSYTSIAVAPDALPVISYMDNGLPLSLKVIKCGDAACTSGNTVTTVDAPPFTDVGWMSSIAIGTDGLPVISEGDNGNTTLKVVKCGNPACSTGNTITTVDNPANMVGFFSSLAIGTDGNPVISYYDSTAESLKVAKCGQPNCSATGAGFSGGSDIGSLGSFWNNVYAAQIWGKQFQIAGFDVAEEYPTSDTTLSTGDLVSASATNFFVEKTKNEYDPNLIGVVSTNPGITLGEWEGNEKTVKVALVGRVPVKVSTENGVIAPGDPLTSSSTPGVAMKATQSGPIVGKALEAYGGSGVGKIMVFVSTGWYVASLTGSDELATSLSNLTRLDVETLLAVTVKAEQIITDELVVSGKTSGSNRIESGQSSATVENSRVGPSSKILITFTGDYFPANRFWVTKKEGESFTVHLDQPVNTGINFDWLIVN